MTTKPTKPTKPAKPPARARASQAAAAPSGDPALAGVTLTHPDRVLYPDVGLTKLDLGRYYEAIAPFMLPHVVGRPLTLVRCPQGTVATGKQPCFYMKHSGAWAPKALARIKIQEKTKVDDYLVLDDLAGLMSLVQMSVLEVHTWGSTREQLEQPNVIVMDLDPDPTVGWDSVVLTAKLLRQRFGDLGLETFVKTTGGKGLHVVAPLEPALSWEQTFDVSRAIAAALEREVPKAFTTVMSKSERHGKIFLDFLRNNRGSTAVAPYSTRARAGATVAVPLHWDELEKKLDPAAFTMATVPKRLAKLKADPWAAAGYFKLRQQVSAATLKKLTATP